MDTLNMIRKNKIRKSSVLEVLSRRGEMSKTQLYKSFGRFRALPIQLCLDELIQEKSINIRHEMAPGARRPTTLYRLN